MVKKYVVLFGIITAAVLLFIATTVYPGGSMFDKNAVGFNWSKNFISNLFAAKAVNGSNNPARIWADAGMIALAISYAIFFINFSKKIPHKGGAKMIKYAGAGGMLFTFLIVTPLHNMMVVLASTMFLISIFYITVFVLKSKLHLLKVLCIICLLVFYFTLYLYGAGPYNLLPVMQKVTFVNTVILILGLEYFTHQKDFISIAKKQPV